MTNLEKWRYYCKDLVSPESFIDWGIYSVIGSALQRRVWRGQENGAPLFPNMYIIFVAGPGVGKGMVTRQTVKLLKHHRSLRKIGNMEKEHYLIPMGANATTYEALLRAITEAVVPFFPPNAPELGLKKPYIHCSISFCLEELGSLFRKHQEELVRFFLEGYDCVDYDYDTKTQGKDMIRNSCVNLLAGTQPSFISKIFRDELVNEGFASRSFFIFEDENRFIRFDPPTFDETQLGYFNDLLEHIKNLTRLYGPVQFTPEALEYLHAWWEKEATGFANQSTRLKYYRARKNIAAQKLAMAIHFLESTDMTIGLHTAQAAILEMESREAKMHMALDAGSKNPVYDVAGKIQDFLKSGPKSYVVLMGEMFSSCPDGKKTLDAAIEFLATTQKIERKDNKIKLI